MDFPHGVLAVDTETTGLDWVRGRIGAVSLAWDVGPSNNLATRNVGLALQLVEEARDAGVKLVFHNAAFDAHFMLRHGVSIDWDNYEDTLIMARLRDNLGDAGLKDLGERYLGVPPNQRDALDDWLKANKFKKGDILQAPDELLLPYAAQDARLTLQLYLHFRDTRSYPGYETILAKEYRVRAIIFEAEEAGVPLDVAATAELATVLEDERSSIEDKLRELGGERNFSSPTQVASLLFDELGYPEIAGRSTDDYVLTMLQAPVPQLIRAYRERSKLAGYLKSYLELEQGGFLYPSLNTVGARTHRFTCKEPNLQQIPARNRWGLRKIFRAHEGWLIGADFDKQELRIGASIANDTRMMEDLVSGEDIYRTMGSQIFHKPAELVTGMERSVAKNCVTPETRVLTGDLDWKPAGELVVGERLIAFEDFDEPAYRKDVFRWAEVTGTGRALRHVYEIELETGELLRSTDNHKWLVREAAKSGYQGVKWLETKDIAARKGKKGISFVRYLPTWERDISFDGGYMSGILDGEGSISILIRKRGDTHWQMSIAQNPGGVADRIRSTLLSRRVRFSESNNGSALHFTIRGGRTAIMRVLGIFQATRLLEKFQAIGSDLFGTLVAKSFSRVLEVRDLGEQEIVTLESSSGTYFAEGFGSHNTALGLNYGMGATKMAEQLTAQFGRVFTINEVTGIRMGYKAMYPQTIQALSRASREAERVGFVTNPWGRRLYVDPEKSYRAWNYLIQPSGGDALKDAIIHVAEVLCAWGGHIILPIHDELWCWMPNEPTVAQQREFEEAMRCDLLALPLTATAHIGRSAQELK